MPIYDHLCSVCGHTEEVICKVEARLPYITCSACGAPAARVVAAQIQRVEPTWLEDAKRQLQPDSRHKIYDRNSFHRHMRQEGISQIG